FDAPSSSLAGSGSEGSIHELGRRLAMGRDFLEGELAGLSELRSRMVLGIGDEVMVRSLLSHRLTLGAEYVWRIIDEQGALDFQQVVELLGWLYADPVDPIGVKCLDAVSLTLLNSYLTQLGTVGSLGITLEWLERTLAGYLTAVRPLDSGLVNLFPVLQIIRDTIVPAWRNFQCEGSVGTQPDIGGGEVEMNVRHEVEANLVAMSRILRLIASVSPLHASVVSGIDLDLGLRRELTTNKEKIFKGQRLDRGMLRLCLKLRDRISAESHDQAEDAPQLTLITNQITNPLNSPINHRHCVSLLEISASHPWTVAKLLLVSASQLPHLAETYVGLLAMLEIGRCKKYVRPDAQLAFDPSRPVLLDALACALVSTQLTNIYTRHDLLWVEVITLCLNKQLFHYHELLSEVFFPTLHALMADVPQATLLLSILSQLQASGPRIPVVCLVTCRFFSIISLLAQMSAAYGEAEVCQAISAILPLGQATLSDMPEAELGQAAGELFSSLIQSLIVTLGPYPAICWTVLPFIELYRSQLSQR
ncbi:hypothetical protein L0F63_001272, partial [Massospora cicadina]